MQLEEVQQMGSKGRKNIKKPKQQKEKKKIEGRSNKEREISEVAGKSRSLGTWNKR